MILSELITTVTDTIRRADQEEIIRLRIVSSLRTLHNLKAFPLDFKEWSVENAEITYSADSNYIGAVNVPNDIRLQGEVKAFDSTGNSVLVEIKSLKEINKYKRNNISVANTGYFSGNNQLSFNTSIVPDSFVFSGTSYTPSFEITNNPNGTQRDWSDPVLSNYTDWLLQYYPIVVSDYVIGYVAASVGEKDISNTHLSIFNSIHLPIILAAGNELQG